VLEQHQNIGGGGMYQGSEFTTESYAHSQQQRSYHSPNHWYATQQQHYHNDGMPQYQTIAQ